MSSQENERLTPKLSSPPSLGWVIVWDLDNTIVGEYSDQRSTTADELVLNPKAVDLLRRIVDARDKDIISANLLLTNNADYFFVKVVELTLAMKFKKNHYRIVFDSIMTRNHPSRAKSDDPPKSLKDIEYMLKEQGLPIDNLAQRVIFIDDKATHLIRNEIPSGHYIQVTPPFVRGGEDRTDYGILEKILESTKGGGKHRRLHLKTKRVRHGKRNLKTRKH
jgi:hypothetical protein